ncbi:MAG: hypothetical protein JNL58_18215 [Planctomyces sp.]|nr:hypothetical protein [Planctomyces sp.]
MQVWIINIFIVVFAVFMWGWDYPADLPIQRFVRRICEPFAFMGLWHGWAMFAPEPIYISRWVRAVISFGDGSIEIWEPLGPVSDQKLVNSLYVRSFKFQHSVVSGQNPVLYEPLCQFLARQANEHTRPVTTIELYRDYRYVQPYGADTVYSPTRSVCFYQYQHRELTSDATV